MFSYLKFMQGRVLKQLSCIRFSMYFICNLKTYIILNVVPIESLKENWFAIRCMRSTFLPSKNTSFRIKFLLYVKLHKERNNRIVKTDLSKNVESVHKVIFCCKTFLCLLNNCKWKKMSGGWYLERVLTILVKIWLDFLLFPSKMLMQFLSYLSINSNRDYSFIAISLTCTFLIFFFKRFKCFIILVEI